jgi:hypothetical protein
MTVELGHRANDQHRVLLDDPRQLVTGLRERADLDRASVEDAGEWCVDSGVGDFDFDLLDQRLSRGEVGA